MLSKIGNSLALIAAITMIGAVGTGCTSSAKTEPGGSARVAVTIPSNLVATSIAKATLTVGPGTGTAFAPIVVDLTNQDLAGKLTWSAFVQNIPSGTGRTFHIDASDGAVPAKVLYTGDATANIVTGATAAIYMVLQETNPAGGSTTALPAIDSLTASAAAVTVPSTPAATVSLTVTAHSPATPANNPLSYLWTANCGTLTGATTTAAVWTAPATITTPACQVNVTVTDSKGGAVTAYLAIVTQAPGANGNAQVAAYPNSWPMISGVVAAETFTKNAAGQIVSLDVDVTVSASDPDGDDLTYVWSSDCTAAGTGFTNAANPTAVATLSTGPGALASNAVHFKSTDVTKGCTLRVDVKDSWKNGIVPVGSGLPVARGGDTVGLILATTPVDFVLAPQITNVTSPNVGNKVQPGQVFVVGVQVLDPTPVFNAAQTPFSYAWSFTGGVTRVAASQIDVTGSPGSSVVQVSIPNPLQTGMSATVVVTNKKGLTATYSWNFVPQNPCDGTAGSVGLACDTGLGLCAGNATGAGTCNAAGACVSATAVTCTALDQCHDAGVCNPAAGTCSNPTKAVGTSCSDANACTTGDVCNASGACVGAVVTCGALDQCHAAGVCDPASGTCSNPVVANGTTCNDGNLCTQTDTCQAGVCVGGNPVNCVGAACTTGGTCNPATGTCQGGANQPNGTACNDGNPCTTGDACLNGACVGSPTCAAGQSCTPATGVCVDTVVAPQAAKDLPLGNFQGLALAEDGTSYVTGVLALPAKLFDTTTLTSAGAGDVFVGKYPAGGGAAVWVKNFGDASDQQPTGLAVTLDGTVAALGQFNGVLGTVNNTGATPIDYLLGINGNTGAISWSKAFNNGVSGVLLSVAANPALNQVAVCGYASAAATDLVPGATYGGGTQDIVIGMFSSSGTLLWSKQIGGANEEECDALAIDDNGDLYAAGKYDGALTFTGTALPSPASSFRRWIWVAKFNGTNGTAISQASFGLAAAAGNHKPQALAVDGSGKLVVSGLMTNSLPFGTTTLVSAGGTDAFVAKLDPAAATPFAPIWATRMGGTAADEARGIAVDSVGNITAVGLFNGTTTGAAVLTAGSATASSAFVLKINGATGAVVANGAAAYGNATNTVNANKVAINRQGIGATKDQVVFGGEYAGTINFGTVAAPITINSANASDFIVFGKLQ